MAYSTPTPTIRSDPMSASLYFHKRDQNEEITLEEWNSAVESAEGVQADAEPVSAQNPVTGETISMGGAPGDASLYFEDEDQWLKIFHFFQGRVSFTYPMLYPGQSPETEPVRAACRALLEQLSDVIITSDEGHEWDFS